jgi:predicted PurR-regulated permease PerM
LVSGDTFLRRLVEILPRYKDKRQAVDISKQIESDVAAYLFTITIMNLAVGVATGAVMALCGVGDPVLWGTVAFLLNYIPILGPMSGVAVCSPAFCQSTRCGQHFCRPAYICSFMSWKVRR